MTTQGIEGLFVATHNWGKAVKFFQALGYQLEFETDHNSGQLRNGDGPYLFVAEVPEDQPTDVQVVVGVDDAVCVQGLDPAIDVITPFQPTHWGTAGDDRPRSRRPDLESPGAGAAPDLNAEPDSSAVRTALWRALHVEVDEPPHLIDDEIGLALAAPDDGWRDRPDMHPLGTRPYRVGIVARTRYVEDLLVDEGITQYILLGAGLDTFVQRHPELGGQVDGVRDRPARPADVEAPTVGRARFRRARLAAARSPSTSRPTTTGGRRSSTPASTPPQRRSCRRAACRCTSPRRRLPRRCAGSPDWRPARS